MKYLRLQHHQANRKSTKKNEFRIYFQPLSFFEKFSIASTTLFWLKNLLFIGILLSFIAAGLRWLFDPQTLPITSVQIEGNNYTSTAQIQALIAVYIVGGFFRINLQTIRETIEVLPWVSHVYIERRWHNGLFLKISEYQPVAIWKNHAVDSSGQVLKFNIAALKGLPVFDINFKYISDTLQIYEELLTILKKVKLNIKKIGQYPNGEKYLILQNDMKLILSRDNIQLKLNRFLKAFPHLLQSQHVSSIQHIDLRYTNGVAIQWYLPHTKLQSSFSYVSSFFSGLKHNGESYANQ